MTFKAKTWHEANEQLKSEGMNRAKRREFLAQHGYVKPKNVLPKCKKIRYIHRGGKLRVRIG